MDLDKIVVCANIFNKNTGVDKTMINKTPTNQTTKEQSLKDHFIPNSPILAHFDFRPIHPDEADQTATIEKICFPPNEACSEAMMKDRVAKAPDLFLVAIDKETGVSQTGTGHRDRVPIPSQRIPKGQKKATIDLLRVQSENVRKNGLSEQRNRKFYLGRRTVV